MVTITFDEAGNTGADLLNKEQPIFSLASSNYTKDEANNLLDIFNRNQGQEIKFKNLRRRKNNHDRLLEFITRISAEKNRNVATIYHKEYVTVTQIVDIIIEWVMYHEGIDIYINGGNIALSNIHHHCINNLCNENISLGIKRSFIEMIRDKKTENIEKFYYYIWQAHGTCIDVNYKDFLEPIIQSEKYISDILEKVNNNFIDPAISSFAVHCSTWTDRLPEKFKIIHDNSKPVFQKKEYLENLMSTEIPHEKIGYDRRKFSFPYNATGIEFADSKDDPRLQVVDIIASCIATWGKGYIDEKYQNELWYKINNSSIEDIVVVKVWPHSSVTPEELGCESSSGTNPLDVMAMYLKNHEK